MYAKRGLRACLHATSVQERESVQVARWCELLIESGRVRASCLAPTRQVSTLVVSVLCDWISFTGERVLICAHFVSFCLIRILMRHFVSSESFSLHAASRGPFLCWIVAAHHGGPPGWPRSSSVVVLLGIGTTSFGGALSRIGAPIGAPTGPYTPPAVFAAGGRFDPSCGTTAVPSCLVWSSCFVFSLLSGVGSGSRVSLVLAPHNARSSSRP